jgi:hypothetical protein
MPVLVLFQLSEPGRRRLTGLEGHRIAAVTLKDNRSWRGRQQSCRVADPRRIGRRASPNRTPKELRHTDRSRLNNFELRLQGRDRRSAVARDPLPCRGYCRFHAKIFRVPDRGRAQSHCSGNRFPRDSRPKAAAPELTQPAKWPDVTIFASNLNRRFPGMVCVKLTVCATLQRGSGRSLRSDLQNRGHV